MKTTIFAVSVQGAVWNNHDQVEDALAVASQVVRHEQPYRSYQGFDETGKSAVVSRPVSVKVEELEWRGGDNGRWMLKAVRHEWLAGDKVR